MARKTLEIEPTGVFWGVDWSTKAISVGWTSPAGDERGVRTITWQPGLKGAARLSIAEAVIEDQARKLAKEFPAVFVYIEQPSGTHNKPTLSYMCGAVQIGIQRALLDHWGRDVEILIVTSGTWKKKVLGRGDYRKPNPKKNETFEYEAIKWCRQQGIAVEDDNEADGVCIAEYARQVVRFV